MQYGARRSPQECHYFNMLWGRDDNRASGCNTILAASRSATTFVHLSDLV